MKVVTITMMVIMVILCMVIMLMMVVVCGGDDDQGDNCGDGSIDDGETSDDGVSGDRDCL